MAPLRSARPLGGAVVRVMLTTPTFFPYRGGAERMADLVARGLVARGHEVTLLVGQEVADHSDPPAPYGLRRYTPPRHRRVPALEAFAVRRHQRELETEVVLGFYAWPLGYAATVCRRFLGGPPVVLTPRGFDLDRTRRVYRRRRQRRATARGYARADRVIAISRYMERRMAEEGAAVGLPLPPVDRIPNAVDGPGLRGAAADSAPPLGGRPYVLSLSRLSVIKRQNVAVEAVRRAADALCAGGLTVVIAGEGSTRETLEAQATDAGVGDLVHFAGQVESGRKAAWLKHARAGLSCSSHEGAPSAVVEQLAFGVPVLLSDIEPHVELRDAAAARCPDAVTLHPLDDAASLGGQLVELASGRPAPEPALVVAAIDRFDRPAMLDAYDASLRAAAGA